MNARMQKVIIGLTTVVLLVAAGCASGNIDDSNSAHVELSVAITDSPPISCQIQAGNTTLTIDEWSATYENLPKNSLATTSPFNDIVIEGITVAYTWPGDPVPLAEIPPPRDIPSPGTVPANGSQTISFEPVLLQDITQSMINTSAVLTMTVFARTPVDDRFSETIGEVLVFEACTGAGSQAPSIVVQPADQTVADGQPATFTVIAQGELPFTYQWELNRNPIAGATDQSYTINNVTCGQSGGLYRVVVTNSLGFTTSNEALLTVTGCP